MQYDPRELHRRSADLIDERGLEYGAIENNFQLIADIASLRLGRAIHPYEIATIMCAVKAARLFANPTHIDSRLDLMNYEAFAAMFAQDYETSAPNDVDFKKKDSLHKAQVVMPAKPKSEERARVIDTALVKQNITVARGAVDLVDKIPNGVAS